jgi:hypothetical protein
MIRQDNRKDRTKMDEQRKPIDLTQIEVMTDVQVLTKALEDQYNGGIPKVPVELLDVLRNSWWMEQDVIDAIQLEMRADPKMTVLNTVQMGMALGVHLMGLKVAEAIALGNTVMPQLLAEMGEGKDKGKVN